MIAAMAKFPNNVLIQRQGALAIRNIVSRLVANTASMETTGTVDTNEIVTGQNESINVRDTFLDLGAEVILRQITGRHQGSVDEAYAALRDLGFAGTRPMPAECYLSRCQRCRYLATLQLRAAFQILRLRLQYLHIP